MPFLDKAGLAHFWNHIVARLNLLETSILERIKSEEASIDDAFTLLLETGVLEATTDEEGFVLTDENNNILTI